MRQTQIGWNLDDEDGKELEETIQDLMDDGYTIQCVVPIRYEVYQTKNSNHSLLFEAMILVIKI